MSDNKREARTSSGSARGSDWVEDGAGRWISAPVTRRGFLQALSSAATGLLMAACGAVRGDPQAGAAVALQPGATPQIVLPSPMPAETATPVAVDEQLALFLRLSTLLTGVEDLSPELGQLYFQSLANDQQSRSLLQEWLGQQVEGQWPAALAELEASGALSVEPLKSLAPSITKLWYTGVYKNQNGEDMIATYVDCLAWQTLRFTKPKTICGNPGFWATAWAPQD